MKNILRLFSLIEEMNIFLVNFWYILKRIWFSHNRLLQEHHSIMMSQKERIKPCWTWFSPWWGLQVCQSLFGDIHLRQPILCSIIFRTSQLVKHHMRYGQGVSQTSLTLRSGDVQLMSNDYKPISSDLGLISIIL